MFKPIKDFVYLSADPEKNRYKNLGNGTKIWIDGAFNPHDTEHCTQDGIVKYLPVKLSKKKKIELKVGDRVFTHHFLCDEDNKTEITGEPLYKLEYDLIYCKYNGKIEMLDGFNFVEPIVEGQISKIIFSPFERISATTGILRHTNPAMIELGAKVGDTVFFSRASDYEMKVEGERYFRMSNEDILAVKES